MHICTVLVGVNVDIGIPISRLDTAFRLTFNQAGGLYLFCMSGHHDHVITKTPYSWFFCVGLFCRCCADLAGGLNHHYGDAAM